ncbi:uncharacterized protein LOC135083090 [Ostrinia nubilalis]|uniref:uncharacterized protein LOC135083090 n=1 Tax=Ostrinia nubilalis TaxID=29057 RepID=UPI003082629F
MPSEMELLVARERCVPTAAALGACHVCVCRADGVYYCRARACKEANVTIDTIQPGKRECFPNHSYREDALFCSCSEDGLWVSHNCRQKFGTITPNSIHPRHKLKTNIKCTPNSLYLLDCNVCECGPNGVIEMSLCTNRKCHRGRKVEACSYGDVLRINDEICFCSDINLYIDRLCLKVEDTAVQEINRTDLERIIDIGKSWTRTNEIHLTACVPGSVLIYDCNRCFCTAAEVWGCTMKGCLAPKILRSDNKKNDFYSLPTLKNEKEKCEPGQQYRIKCNSCICSKKNRPICTTMLCMEDIVVDKKALEAAYREGPNFNPSRSIHGELPPLPDGDCEAGKMYKKDCNTCRCGMNNSVICTKMSCLTKKDMDRVKQMVVKQKLKEKEEEKKNSNNKIRKVRIVAEAPIRDCVPGKMYQRNCRGCYCDYNKNIVCVREAKFCSRNYYPDSPDDMRPKLSRAELDALPTLGHISEKCTPGKAYKVDCNSCVCMINYSLMCDKMLCLSYDDMHRLKAEKASNKNCTKGAPVKPPGECIQCSCSDQGKVICQEIHGCLSEDDKKIYDKLDKKKPKVALTMSTKEKCVAGAIYKRHCNRCYCQPGGSMRCTQKTCLNYAQSLKIQKQRLYLQRHGL